MENLSYEQLMAEFKEYRGSRTTGIILTSIATFLFELGCCLIWLEFIGVIFWIPMIPLYAVGIPKLIKGIVKTANLNRKIKEYKKTYGDPAAKTIPQAAPQYIPQEAPQYIPQEAPQYVPQEAPQYVPQTAPQYVPQGNIALDWQKYAPLDAGVSYKPDKDYKFHRAEGFAGSVPQNFVNRTFPKCPICCSAEPYWTIAQHNQMSWKGNLYLFKCSACEGIISMSMPDVTTLGNGGSGIAANPSVGLTNLIAKSSSGKEAGAVYAVIESVGNSGVTPECQGKEFKLEHMQEMFLRA